MNKRAEFDERYALLKNSGTGETLLDETAHCNRWERLAVEVIFVGASTGSVQLQVSGDNSTWYNLGSAITESGFIQIPPGLYPWIKAAAAMDPDSTVTVYLHRNKYQET